MNLYEVIYSGSQGQCEGNEDTIFLVRAPDFHLAVEIVDLQGIRYEGNVKPLAWVVYEIGVDLSWHPIEGGTRILRGPYFAFAYNYGWRSWRRKTTGRSGYK